MRKFAAGLPALSVTAATGPVHEVDYAGAMRQCQYAWLELKDRLWHFVIDGRPSAAKDVSDSTEGEKFFEVFSSRSG